jgi:hypothetical protein
MSAPSGHSWGHYLFSIALTVALFTAVAPILAAFMLMLPAFFFSPSPAFGALIELTRTAYSLGGVPAAIAGLFVALVSSFIRREWTLYLLAALAGAIASAGYFILPALIETPSASLLPASFLLRFIVVGAAAAPVCTLFARPLGLRPPETAAPTSPEPS